MDTFRSKLSLSRKGSKDKNSATPSRPRSSSTHLQTRPDWQQSQFTEGRVDAAPRTSLQSQWQLQGNRNEIDDQLPVRSTSLQWERRGDGNVIEDHFQMPSGSLQLQGRGGNEFNDRYQVPRTSLQLQGRVGNEFNLERSNSNQSHNSVRTYPGASHRSRDMAGRVPTVGALRREKIIERYTPAALKENSMSTQSPTSATAHVPFGQTEMFHNIELNEWDSHSVIRIPIDDPTSALTPTIHSVPPSYHNPSRPSSSSRSSQFQSQSQSHALFHQPAPTYQPPRSNRRISGYEKNCYGGMGPDPFSHLHNPSEDRSHDADATASREYLANSSQRNWGHAYIQEVVAQSRWERELAIWKGDSKAGRTRRYTAFVVTFFSVLVLVLVLVWWFTRHAGQKTTGTVMSAAGGYGSAAGVIGGVAGG